MEDIAYVNEHAFPGLLGNIFVGLSFAAALLAFIAYYMSSKKDDRKWLKIGRWGFLAHAIGVFGIMITLFFILFNHYYEYEYASKHLNDAMPMRYIFSCFWGGQQGSFLLWTFWNVVLGAVLIWRSRKWEAPVMMFFCLAQVFLASMLIGVHFGDFQLGDNPFVLLRDTATYYGQPWTYFGQYLVELPSFRDGQGLNPLLQNYWMTIHPPTTFLGFSSTVVPFCFAAAGLFKRDYTGWIKPAIPWAFFGVAALGTGLLMGGAWAYEALGFGGFWAWDPVENASLVPWLTLVGAAHLMVINKRKPTALFTTFLLTLGTYILILYSTFLTRSGVLGDTSVHSFVDSGILPQLLFFLLFFVVMCVALIFTNRKFRWIYLGVSALVLLIATGEYTKVTMFWFFLFTIAALLVAWKTSFPKQDEEEGLWSREFWIFIGSLVLTLAAFHITLMNSVPIFNMFCEAFSGTLTGLHNATDLSLFASLAEANFNVSDDPFGTYHKWQIPFAILICMLIAVGQFFKYGKTNMSQFTRKIGISFGLSFVIIGFLYWWTGFKYDDIRLHLLLFTCVFAATANLDYFTRVLKGKVNFSGASIAHIGFAVVLIGAIWSTSQRKISDKFSDVFTSQLSEDVVEALDVTLTQNDTISFGNYFASYRSKEMAENGYQFRTTVDFFEKNPKIYRQGDVIQFLDEFYYCRYDHRASSSLIEDIDSMWSIMPAANPNQVARSAPWTNGEAGEFLFTLNPSVISTASQRSREPSIDHAIGRDFYSFLKSQGPELADINNDDDFIHAEHRVRVGSFIKKTSCTLRIDSLTAVHDREKHMLAETDMSAKLVITISDGKRDTIIEPLFIVRDRSLLIPDVVDVPDFGLRVQFSELHPENNEATLLVDESKAVFKDYIVLAAYTFPGINILWLGCIIMVIGTVMAIRNRIKEFRRSEQKKTGQST